MIWININYFLRKGSYCVKCCLVHNPLPIITFKQKNLNILELVFGDVISQRISLRSMILIFQIKDRIRFDQLIMRASFETLVLFTVV